MIIRVDPPIKVDLPVGYPVDLARDLASWQVVPFYTSPNQTQNARQCLDLFKNLNSITPCELAGLSQKSIKKSITFQSIDHAFKKAMDSYEEDLVNAMGADRSFMSTLSTRDSSQDFYRAVATGSMRLSSQTPNISGIKYVVAPIFSFLGGIWGMYTQNFITRETIYVEASAHRERWVNEVRIKEQMRIKDAIRVIETRAKTVDKNIQDNQAIGLQDDEDIEELKLLNTFMNFISPTTPLRIKNKLVLEYLEELTS